MALACLLAVQLSAQTGPAADVSFQEIEESLTCQCGCGLTVHSCNHLQCPSALPLRAEIREQMALGKDKAAILAHFEEKYGEKILSAPTVEGFNLLAWTIPFVLVAVGALFVGLTVRHWAKRRAATVQRPVRPTVPASPYSEVLEKELKDFDA
jgi:cytochrome c-type biogenesis protein CcmH